MSAETKFKVNIFPAEKPKKIPKSLSVQLKGAVSPKMVSKMKKESINCPVVNKELGFLVCFSCPSFLRRVSGVVDCAGTQPPPSEWVIG